ncbi:multiheme c-type cytochrome [Shewanella saliphila]|uniref:Outer membrane cytochrome MtrC/MtrF-like domain-containing protein n=1 Tax=Shewanella saliphila TaxID=2282698 RepID=A0ABQ2QAY2_9GAMM|nr:cytochrome C [Shewanella saliphila]MCL1103243.1 cytochrome C [Shewanella saliphila]GGP67588.1 hypothetical protein GCM10009409_35790 [Shewanella saliphila]
MKRFKSKKLAYLVALALTSLLMGCDGDDGAAGADGVDGVDGVDGQPGDSWTLPVVTSSTETNVKVINYTLGEGSISYEFEVTNENGELVNGLIDAEGKVAALTDKGFINNRNEDPINEVADNVHIGGAVTMSTEGATLTALGDGHYQFTAPMLGVNTGTEGIVWLRVGGNSESGIARSDEYVLNKPEGSMSTTTEACYACHVDYSTSPNKHASYVAQGMDGEVTFVEGCLTCHGSVSREMVNEEGFSTGSYARNTLSKIGHINHQEFETGFSVMNCSSCHTEPTININVAGPGCIDCHDTGGIAGDIIPGNGSDVRLLHEANAGIDTDKAINNSYKVTGTPVALNSANQWCTTMSLYKVEGDTETLLDLHSMFEEQTTAHNPEKPINYAGSYLHGVYNNSIVGRVARFYDYSYEADGSKTMCYTDDDVSLWTGAGLMSSLRVSFTSEDYNGDESDVITIHGYTDVTDIATEEVSAYDRRHAVGNDSCTTCHNDENNFHKNGNFSDGGLGCVACHNNGQDRKAGYSAPGFGPMVHSMHWGVGSISLDADNEEVSNAASVIAPQTSCVACHDSGVVDLTAVPNQFIKASAYGVNDKMASPITANCYACHNEDYALAHMVQNGGTTTEDVPATEWYKLNASESCATCHAEGRSSGIEKYHNFTR